MLVHFDALAHPQMDSSISQIRHDAGRTLLRMWIALCFALVFAVGTGYLVAKNSKPRVVLLPALDAFGQDAATVLEP